MDNIARFSLPDFNNPDIPFAFLKRNSFPESGTVLAADVGGTKTNMGLFTIKDSSLQLLKKESYPTKEYNSFIEVYQQFYNGNLPKINAICLGVAGPVINGTVKGTNFSWEIDGKKLESQLNMGSVTIINDMEAHAYGLAVLPKNSFENLHSGQEIPGNAALIAPGTGLGEAGMYWDGSNYHPFPSEGGHCDFCSRNQLDFQIDKYLGRKYGHVSWERLISGPGIQDVYTFLRAHSRKEEPQWLSVKMVQGNPPSVISNSALEGKDPICIKTLELFLRFLAIESAQLALKFKATAGIFVGGGILPKIVKRIDKDIFNSHFVQSGRMNPLLERVPVKVILNDETPLLGAALFGAANGK